MRIAIFAGNMDKRYGLSRLVEEDLLKKGVLPEMVLFPVLGELLDRSADQRNAYDFAIICNVLDTMVLRRFCDRVPTILIGSREEGPAAFDIGARYFIEEPFEKADISRAIAKMS